MNGRRPCKRGGTLGETLRAARLGYGYLPDLGAWCRVKDGTAGGFVTELVPDFGALPRRSEFTLSGTAHRVWWEVPTLAPDLTECILRAVAPSAKRARLKRPMALSFTDEGNLIPR